MAILMEPAVNFTAKIASGEIIRYGAILKNAGTGEIVGHLKEVGKLGSMLASTGISPFDVVNVANPLNLVTSAANLGLSAVNTAKLTAVQQTLEGMELATNAAALSSIAGLGVSVGGFAVLNAKLNRINSRLDEVATGIGRIQQTLVEMQVQWEAMSLARLETAAEALITAEKASSESRRVELASKAAADFSLLKNYYGNLLRSDGLFEDVSLGIDQIYELIARYTFCCMGLIHAEFVRGDKGAYRSTLDCVQEEYSRTVGFSAHDVYLARCDKQDVLALQMDFESLSHSLVQLHDYYAETTVRLESYSVELDFIEANKLAFAEYQSQLKAADTNLVVLPASKPGVAASKPGVARRLLDLLQAN